MRAEKAALYREATRAATLGLIINGGLGVIKLAGGLIAHSYALISDAVNSLMDLGSSSGVVFALWFAQRPPDKEHPYGHTRAEAIAGSHVALLILLTAVLLAWEVARNLFAVRLTPPAWTLAIAGSNVLIKEVLYRYNILVGRRLASSILIANAWDHRCDALSSLAVLIGLTATRLGGPSWSFADPLMALVVILIIARSGVHLLLSSIGELMDAQADEGLVASVRDAARDTPGVEEVEKLWVRKSGIEYLVDIHVEIDGCLPIAEGHRIGHLVEDSILNQFPAVRDVLVHIEPFPPHVHHNGQSGQGSTVAVSDDTD